MKHIQQYNPAGLLEGSRKTSLQALRHWENLAGIGRFGNAELAVSDAS